MIIELWASSRYIYLLCASTFLSLDLLWLPSLGFDVKGYSSEPWNTLTAFSGQWYKLKAFSGPRPTLNAFSEPWPTFLWALPCPDYLLSAVSCLLWRSKVYTDCLLWVLTYSECLFFSLTLYPCGSLMQLFYDHCILSGNTDCLLWVMIYPECLLITACIKSSLMSSLFLISTFVTFWVQLICGNLL